MPSYIPSKQADELAWLTNFSTILSASPATYGLTAGDAAAVAASLATYQAAYTAGTEPATRTKATVAAKDAARSAVLALVRPYAVMISLSSGISDDNKTRIGVTVRDHTVTILAAPATAPIVTPTLATPGQIRLRVADEVTPTKKAKPAAAIGLELRAAVLVAPPSDPADIPYQGFVTRAIVDVSFDPADAGKKAYFAGRWINRRGEVGPWSAVQTFTVAG
jgi:hypothetical protein